MVFISSVKRGSVLKVSNEGVISTSATFVENSFLRGILQLPDSTFICVGYLNSSLYDTQATYFLRLASNFSIIISVEQKFTENEDQFTDIIQLTNTTVGIFGKNVSNNIKNTFYVECDFEGNVLSVSDFAINAHEKNSAVVKRNSSFILCVDNTINLLFGKGTNHRIGL